MIKYIQGDVIFKKVENMESLDDFEPVLDNVVVRGEQNSHILSESGKLFKKESSLYIVGGTEVIHPTHAPIFLPEGGIYKVSIVREYDHFLEESRSVKD